MDNPPQLGKLIAPDERAFRDAIHVAVAPMRAGHRLLPGQHVGLSASDFTVAGDVPEHRRIGIVDPYLTEPVEEGERFWLCLYPQTVTGLRHVWNHPAFTARVPGKEAGA